MKAPSKESANTAEAGFSPKVNFLLRLMLASREMKFLQARVIFLLRKSDIVNKFTVIFYSPLLLLTAEGNITTK